VEGHSSREGVTRSEEVGVWFIIPRSGPCDPEGGGFMTKVGMGGGEGEGFTLRGVGVRCAPVFLVTDQISRGGCAVSGRGRPPAPSGGRGEVHALNLVAPPHRRGFSICEVAFLTPRCGQAPYEKKTKCPPPPISSNLNENADPVAPPRRPTLTPQFRTWPKPAEEVAKAEL